MNLASHARPSRNARPACLAARLPTLTQKRLGDAAKQILLGDGFYEQRLINEQVAQLTGRRYLGDYQNDEAQYQALMNAGIAYAQAQQLRPGIALNSAQMAALTSDLVWLVERSIVFVTAGSKISIPICDSEASMPNLSVKLDEATRLRLQEIAASQGLTPHAFMVRAIGTELEQAEAEAAFVARALAARERVVASGQVIDGPAFAEYLRCRVRGQTSPRPAVQAIQERKKTTA